MEEHKRGGLELSVYHRPGERDPIMFTCSHGHEGRAVLASHPYCAVIPFLSLSLKPTNRDFYFISRLSFSPFESYLLSSLYSGSLNNKFNNRLYTGNGKRVCC